ncbi:MAG TPA: ester cyclase [Vicinamibacterales bacterium]|nr:ester cyclase [Vicinamibacterales bacterium]
MMSPEDVRGFFADRVPLWKARNAQALADGHAVDGRVSSPMWRERLGRDAILESYRQLFETFPDWDFQGQDLIIDGPLVAQSFSATATLEGEFMGLPPTHRRCQIEGVRLYEMKDGLIQSERRMYDFTGLLIQLGVLKSKPTR